MKIKSFIFLLNICLLTLFVSCSNIKNTDIISPLKDSVSTWIDLANNKTLSKKNKNTFLKKAYLTNKEFKDDSIKLFNLHKIAFTYYRIKDSTRFENKNKEALLLAKKMNHSYGLARIHWNYAIFYKKSEKYDKSYFHYHNACSYFERINEDKMAGIMLYYMAFIKGRYRDFIQSEILNIKAIEKFKRINEYDRLYRAYNHLATLQIDIKEYDKALIYFNKALLYIDKLKNKKDITIYNNMALTYMKKRKYDIALEYYNKELKNDITVSSYARVINNKAYCKLLMKDTIGIKKDFFRALFIRDSINSRIDILSSKKNISKYYSYIKDTTKALKYAKEANFLAKKINNGGNYLETLKLLADLDLNNSSKYLNKYISFNDSLITVERNARNKFTRIQFETDEHIEKAEKLNEQNLLITISSFATILVLTLLYFIRVQKIKNEKLQLEADEKKANEEVYLLTLQQQAKLEEERIIERNRISAELHDGILGKLFGTRVNLGFLAMNMSADTQQKHQAFLEELQHIEKEIRDVSHKLSVNFDISSINFSTIIAQLLKDKSDIGNFKYEYNCNQKIDWKQLNEVTKANIYRIIQEILQNIIKHAKAKNVTLDFSIQKTNIVILLKDDGVGFNTQKSKKGIGLKNIKIRVQKLKGTLYVKSQVQKGTSIQINIPHQ